MGLLSLQTFILLLELGRERVRMGKPFLFAMEEPELHVPPGMQRRLISQAVSIAEADDLHHPLASCRRLLSSSSFGSGSWISNPAQLAATPMLPWPPWTRPPAMRDANSFSG